MARDHIGDTLTVFGQTFDMQEGRPIRRVQYIDTSKPGDYGWDPVLDEAGQPTGSVKMVPSGRIVPAKDARSLLG